MFIINAASPQSLMWTSGLLSSARAGQAPAEVARVLELFKDSPAALEHIEFTMAAVMISRVLHTLGDNFEQSDLHVLTGLLAPTVKHRLPQVTTEALAEEIKMASGDFSAMLLNDTTLRIALHATIASVLTPEEGGPFDVTHTLKSSPVWDDCFRVEK